jgi:hypothetical protein
VRLPFPSSSRSSDYAVVFSFNHDRVFRKQDRRN